MHGLEILWSTLQKPHCMDEVQSIHSVHRCDSCLHRSITHANILFLLRLKFKMHLTVDFSNSSLKHGLSRQKQPFPSWWISFGAFRNGSPIIPMNICTCLPFWLSYTDGFSYFPSLILCQNLVLIEKPGLEETFERDASQNRWLQANSPPWKVKIASSSRKAGMTFSGFLHVCT